jgi:1-pyrroline-5-carboxylate dehydrogenase
MTAPAATLSKGEFHNEPFTEFSKPETRKAMEEALRHLKSMFGREYPLTIGGERVTTTEKTIQSLC